MKKYLLLILLASIIAGCKKKNEPKPTPPAAPPVLLKNMRVVIPGTPDSLVNNYAYTYNDHQQLTNIHIGQDYPLQYNDKGLLVSYGGISAGGIFMQFQYDQNNNPESSTTTTYDGLSHPYNQAYYTYTIANGQVMQINQLNSPNGALVQTYHLTYDQAGNVTEMDIIEADGSVRGTNQSTFGNHHSTFYTNHIKFYLTPDLDDNYFNPNEKLTQTSVNSLGTTQFNFTYTFNGLYPTSEIISTYAGKNFYYFTYSGLSN